MRIKASALMVFLLTLSSHVLAIDMDEDERAEQQQALDEACEQARQTKLAPLRRQYTDECIAKGEKSPDACERFYADYGNPILTESGTVLPGKFYDLPECVRAFEFRRSYRSGEQ